mmetsp:Transcript_27537/g.68000  ORF Transcript_27537/g.68000 Transcript_27537/m.68000 type:complete len:570 (+) Transcript_27537:203-1912(+)
MIRVAQTFSKSAFARGRLFVRCFSASRWDFPKLESNYTQLSPLSYLARTAKIYPDVTSVVHNNKSFTWEQTAQRCRALASALNQRGIGKGDAVSVICSNTPEMYESYFGIPMSGAVLNTINTRLDAETIAYIIGHAKSKAVICDTEFASLARDALAKVKHDVLCIDVKDSESGLPDELMVGVGVGESVEYEKFLSEGDPDYEWKLPADEWDAITLSYTSGTTGRPKGVVAHHRGIYLYTAMNVPLWDMTHFPKYLWTLPMFHCNGWCFPWTMALLAGTNICLRKVTAGTVYKAISEHGANYMCAAPIVLSFLANASPEERKTFSHKVKIQTAASPPPAAVLQAMEELGFEVVHTYGLTEVAGPGVSCAWRPEWDELSIAQQAQIKALQGVHGHMLEDVAVLDPLTMKRVPSDGQTLGEVMWKGNTVMKGYLSMPEETERTLAGGWFHSGDLGVCHPDGYIELKDRSKDIIISGGENISSIEVENALFAHPAVLLCSVVARPDDKWGETPCAFIELKESTPPPTEQEIIDFAREKLPQYMRPKSVIFGELPKTSTGKVQKYVLRQRVREL